MGNLRVGQIVSAGDLFGNVHENSLLEHRIMLPPNMSGRLTYVAPAGTYTIEDTVLELEDADGVKHKVTMMHKWPVRTPPRGREARRFLPAAHRSACARLALPVRARWHVRHSGCLRLRQDCDFAGSVQVLELAVHYLRRLRRAR
eukprot:EC813661.1.p1 GENE.EC813661.1~~EC813661.1.p1  ORF type:complete len:145 (+),score=21.40 EC813661.1:115-549(+)